MIAGKQKAAAVEALAIFFCAGVAFAQPNSGASKNTRANSSVSSPLPAVAYFSKKDVDANFEHHKGMDDTLYDPDYGTQNFKVKTSGRVKTLNAETHMKYTDIVY